MKLRWRLQKLANGWKEEGQGLVGNHLKSFPPHYSLFTWHLDSCARVVKQASLIPPAFVGRAFCSRMKQIYFCAGYHQLSRPLGSLNYIEMDSQARIMVVHRNLVDVLLVYRSLITQKWWAWNPPVSLARWLSTDRHRVAHDSAVWLVPWPRKAAGLCPAPSSGAHQQYFCACS